jgi:hypothetical protein
MTPHSPRTWTTVSLLLALGLCACTPLPIGEVGRVVTQGHGPVGGRFVIAKVDDKKDYPGDFFAMVYAHYSRGTTRHECIDVGPPGGGKGAVLSHRFDLAYRYTPDGLYLGIPDTGAQLLCLRAVPGDAVRITVSFDHEDFDARDDLLALDLQIPATDSRPAAP